jgi:DNA recombination protein RmuC
MAITIILLGLVCGGLAWFSGRLKAENFRLVITLEQERKAAAGATMAFENISNKLLKVQREEFSAEQKAAVSSLMSPFAQQIRDFRELVEKTNMVAAADKGALSKELASLREMNTTLSSNATALADALRGNSKVQGDWGERRLRDILDMSGMMEGIDYRLQANFKNDIGQNRRPDCVIMLPNGSQMVVDAKVSIANYADFCRADSDDERRRHIELHIRSVREHIKELATQEYHKFMADNSIDFVFMFIPNEQAYIEALRFDPSIYDNAYKSNIAIVTPSSILPVLRTVRNLWNIEKQNQNASLIAEKAGRLYDKLYGFIENMKRIDKSLFGARTAYDEAFAQLSTGRGAALSIAEDMKEMGAKTAKAITLPKGSDDGTF